MKDLIKSLKETSSKVIALAGSDYEGLVGRINEILTMNNGESDIDFKIAVVVDFEEPEYINIEDSHPHLNGTSIEQVIFADESIQELGFYKGTDEQFAFHLNGKVICPHCFTPMEQVIETQYDDISWHWNEEKKTYEKYNAGASDGKKCSICNEYIDDPDEIFQY